jgi:hypothetical protein
MVHLVDLSLSQIVHQLHLATQNKKHLVSSFLLDKKPFARKKVHLLEFGHELPQEMIRLILKEFNGYYNLVKGLFRDASFGLERQVVK